MERAKQLGKIDARCILETAGHLIDHASRVTYELRGVAVAVHEKGSAALRAEEHMVAAGENYIAATLVLIV